MISNFWQTSKRLMPCIDFIGQTCAGIYISPKQKNIQISKLLEFKARLS